MLCHLFVFDLAAAHHLPRHGLQPPRSVAQHLDVRVDAQAERAACDLDGRRRRVDPRPDLRAVAVGEPRGDAVHVACEAVQELQADTVSSAVRRGL